MLKGESSGRSLARGFRTSNYRSVVAVKQSLTIAGCAWGGRALVPDGGGGRASTETLASIALIGFSISTAPAGIRANASALRLPKGPMSFGRTKLLKELDFIRSGMTPSDDSFIES